MLLIESGLALVILVTAPLIVKDEFRLFGLIERGLARIANRPQLAVLLVGLTALTLRAIVIPILPIPYAGVPDEFSYLLMSDTFSHGRLTNPTHPLWIHFENVNVIHQPSYCSVYYPAQGFL